MRVLGEEQWTSESLLMGYFDLNPETNSQSVELEIRNLGEPKDVLSTYAVRILDQCSDPNGVDPCDADLLNVLIEQDDNYENAQPIIYNGKMKDMVEGASDIIVVGYNGDEYNKIRITIWYDPNDLEEGDVLFNSYSMMFYEVM